MNKPMNIGVQNLIEYIHALILEDSCKNTQKNKKTNNNNNKKKQIMGI